jgi:hypothetical protein
MAANVYPLTGTAPHHTAFHTSQNPPGYGRGLFEGRPFDFSRPFMPNKLSSPRGLEFLTTRQRMALNQIQGRSYTNMLGMLAELINAGAWSWTRGRGGDRTGAPFTGTGPVGQVHARLFAHVEDSFNRQMPAGYLSAYSAHALAGTQGGTGDWPMLALATYFGHLTRVHYQCFVAPDESLCRVFKGVLRHHHLEHQEYEDLDELELRNEDHRLTAAQRDRAVNELIGITRLLEQVTRLQAHADSEYFFKLFPRVMSLAEQGRVRGTLLRTYLRQHLLAVIFDRRFLDVLVSLTKDAQQQRLATVLARLAGPA